NIRHHSQQIAIATAIMKHGLDPNLLLYHHRSRHGSHARLRAWAIRNVHAIDASVFEKTNRIECLCRTATFWRQDFDSRHELAGGDLSRPVRSFFSRHHGDVRRLQVMHADLHRLSHRDLLRPRMKLPDRVGDHLDVCGCRATASAHALSARLTDASRILRHIFRRAHVDLPATHLSRPTRVRLLYDFFVGQGVHFLHLLNHN